MKTIKRLFKYTFVSAPQSIADMVQFNSDRIGFLTVMVMIIVVFMAIFGKLPTWSILN